MANNSNTGYLEFQAKLLQSLNSKVEIITNFSSITGEVIQVLTDYIVVKEFNDEFTIIPLYRIDSLIFFDKEGDL
ncbi:hypothetical protein [Priestia megaterium]|uniref:hypothetical protein n=1 Tax=Priestia megaterium TaxID=1404 RepID=UPI000BA77F69|nr:hypothetical protein [Priestia megaterium]PAK49512.1 hypothetical protein CHH47_13005 [Priestia megaterium]